MPFQPKTMLGANVSAGGYSIVFTGNPAPTFAACACKGGEYWVRPFGNSTTKTTTEGANANITDPRTGSPTVIDDWVRLQAGDEFDFGAEASLPGGEFITQLDIWVVTAGASNDLIVNAH